MTRRKTRRTFLATSIAIASGIVGSATLNPQRKLGKKSPVNLGLLLLQELLLE